MKNPCVKCGETEPILLDFDHIDDKNGLVTEMDCISKLEEEIKLCQILCVRCHRLKTQKKNNSFKYQKYLERNTDVSVVL